MEYRTFQKIVEPLYINYAYTQKDDREREEFNKFAYGKIGDRPEDSLRKMVKYITDYDQHFPTIARMKEVLRAQAKQKEFQALPEHIEDVGGDWWKAFWWMLGSRFKQSAQTKEMYPFGAVEYWMQTIEDEKVFRQRMNALCDEFDEPRHFTDDELKDHVIAKYFNKVQMWRDNHDNPSEI